MGQASLWTGQLNAAQIISICRSRQPNLATEAGRQIGGNVCVLPSRAYRYSGLASAVPSRIVRVRRHLAGSPAISEHVLEPGGMLRPAGLSRSPPAP
jgi:hypothetical protein